MFCLAKYKKVWCAIAATFLIIVVFIPIILTRTCWFDCLAFDESTGWIGDTLGGITAPFIGFVNIVLLIWTLHKQIEFNKIGFVSPERRNEALDRCTAAANVI